MCFWVTSSKCLLFLNPPILHFSHVLFTPSLFQLSFIIFMFSFFNSFFATLDSIDHISLTSTSSSSPSSHHHPASSHTIWDHPSSNGRFFFFRFFFSFFFALFELHSELFESFFGILIFVIVVFSWLSCAHNHHQPTA